MTEPFAPGFVWRRRP